MVKERCWKCDKMRSDIELRASDDRLCEQMMKNLLLCVAAVTVRTVLLYTENRLGLWRDRSRARHTSGSLNLRANKGEDETG